MIFAFFCLPALFFSLISKDTPMDEERRVETTKQALALTERIKEYDEKKYSELKLVEEFTNCYNAGDYKAADKALRDLNSKFSKSKYIKMIKKEYPDLADKRKEQERQERKSKKKGDFMTNAQRSDMVRGMLLVMDNIIKNDIDEDGIYASFRYNSIGQLAIYVNDNKWDGLSREQKISFITKLGTYYDETVRPQLSEYTYLTTTLYFRTLISGLSQGSWDSTLQPKYDLRE